MTTTCAPLREPRIGAQGGVRAQLQTADDRRAAAARRAAASATTTSTGSPVCTSELTIPAMPPPRRSRTRGPGPTGSGPSGPPGQRGPIAGAGSGASSTASAAPRKSSGSPTTSIGGGAQRRPWRRTSRGDTAPPHSLTSSATTASRGPSVSTVGRCRRPRPAHGAPPDADGEAHVAALPHRPRVGQPRGGHEQRDIGVRGAERREARRAPRPGRGPSSSPATTASTRCTGTRSSGRSTAAACASKAARKRVDVRRGAPGSPRRRGGRRGARGARRTPRSPPSRSNAGIERPEPVPCSPSSATSTHGRWWRSAIREATIPMTPGCHPSPASTYALRSPASATMPSASKRMRCSTWRRSAFARSSSSAIARARSASAVSSSSTPASARYRRPAAFRRGARRKPIARASMRAGSALRHAHERAQALAARRAHRTQAGAHQPAVLPAQRDAVGDRGERDELEVLRPLGVVVAQRPGEHVRRRPPRTARGTGSRRRAGCTSGASGSRPSARGLWWSVTTTSMPAARAGATSSTAVMPQSTVTSSRVPRAARRSTVAADRP